MGDTRMTDIYTITHAMLMDLARAYAKQLNEAERFKTLSPSYEEKWVIARDNFVNILLQLSINGGDIEQIISEIESEMDLTFTYRKVEIKVDGAARNNHDVTEPNKAGFAFTIIADGVQLKSYAEYLGSHVTTDIHGFESIPATNNVAEYIALIKSLEYLVEHHITAPEIKIYSDSEVVVNQMNFRNATRAPHLIALRDYAIGLTRNLPVLEILHVNREYNSEVDDMVNIAIDEALKEI